MSIWEELKGKNYIKNINKTVFRVVEDQAKSATRKLVSSQKKHDILEEMLEKTKPRILVEANSLHYLLSTPFRYPTLKYGSRFCSKNNKSLFYSSLEIKTALSEVAFYRLAFLKDSEANLGNKVINYTSFKANVKTQKGIDLTEPPFYELRHQISSPSSYTYSQPLGESMRKDKIEVCISYSAREKNEGKNVNIFSPKALANNSSIEDTFQNWKCFATKEVVEFIKNMSYKPEKYSFSISDFYIDGEFPGIPKN